MRVALLLSIVSCFIFAGGVDGLPVGIETAQAATVKPPPKYVKSKKPVKAKAKKSLKLHKKPARKSASAKARAFTKKTSLIKPKTKSAKPVKSKAKPKRNLKYQRKPAKAKNSTKRLKNPQALKKAYKNQDSKKNRYGSNLSTKSDINLSRQFNIKSIGWPKNGGFLGKPRQITLKPGVKIDRYGEGGGTFASPKGTPYLKRSLPTGSHRLPYNAYIVVKPITGTLAGKVAPAFNKPGLGMQYKLPKSIDQLVRKGYLKKIR